MCTEARKPRKEPSNFSTQCNSWCLFITFHKIIKSLRLEGASLPFAIVAKANWLPCAENFEPKTSPLISLTRCCNLWSRYQFLFHVIMLVKCSLVKLIFIFLFLSLARSYHHYDEHIDVDFLPHLPTAKRTQPPSTCKKSSSRWSTQKQLTWWWWYMINKKSNKRSFVSNLFFLLQIERTEHFSTY